MKSCLFLMMMTLLSCGEKTGDVSVDNLSLEEIEQRIEGNWKIVEIKTKEKSWTPHSSKYTIEYFELNELKGINGKIIYNEDGTIETKTRQPECELKTKDGNKIIEFVGLTDWTEMKIVKLSNNEMVLVDSTYTVTYTRQNESR